MVVHVGDDLGGGGAVVLHDVPVFDAGCAGEGGGEDADVVSEGLAFLESCVGEFGAVGACAEEEVAAGEGHDVEEGDEEGC